MMHTPPKISIYIATSIDGYIARTDGSLDWLNRVGGFDEDYGFKTFVNSVDAVIMGRKTYEVAYTAYGTPNWPYHGKRMIVLSTTLQTVVPEVQLYNGDLILLINQLQTEGIHHIWIDGGVTISQFLKLNRVNEITLSLIPILLGSGFPLFSIKQEIPCHLISSQSYPSGLVQLHYAFTSDKSALSTIR